MKDKKALKESPKIKEANLSIDFVGPLTRMKFHFYVASKEYPDLPSWNLTEVQDFMSKQLESYLNDKVAIHER